jgi:LCP family protein required for cell wall assembly
MTFTSRRNSGKRVGKRSGKTPRKPRNAQNARAEELSQKRVLFALTSLLSGLAGLFVSIWALNKGYEDLSAFFYSLKTPQTMEYFILTALTASALLICIGGFFMLSLKFKRSALIFLISSCSLVALALGGLVTARALIGLPNTGDAPSIVVNPPRNPDGGTEIQDVPVARDVYTFLLAGIHEGLTDTIMVATLDVQQKTCHVMSIPRDTYIPKDLNLRPNSTRNLRKINGAYANGGGTRNATAAMELLKQEVATLIGYQPQYTVVVDYRAVQQLVNALDGVDFDVPVRMSIPAEGINLQRGLQTLNGNQAMQLLRFRGYGPNALKDYFPEPDGPVNDDYGRMKIQQAFLTAAAKKALSNWTKIGEYIKIAEENVTNDDMDWGSMLGFAETLNQMGIDNIQFHTLPTKTFKLNGDFEYVLADEAVELINSTINPFTSDIERNRLEYFHPNMR